MSPPAGCLLWECYGALDLCLRYGRVCLSKTMINIPVAIAMRRAGDSGNVLWALQ